VLPGPPRGAEDFGMAEARGLASQQSRFRRPWVEAEWEVGRAGRLCVGIDWVLCFVSMEGLRG
jgi:hypothetical protein